LAGVDGVVLGQGRPTGDRVLPSDWPGGPRMRAWLRDLPRDPIAGRVGPAGAVRWGASASFRNHAVSRLDIPPDSRAGMAGAFANDHTH
jgi:hypothetical protein